MKKRSSKLEKVMSLAAAEERRIGQATGSTRRYLDLQLERMGELNAYRQSYAEKSRMADCVTPAHWRDYQNFIERLDHAVRAQQQIVRDSEQNLATHRRRWMVKRQRLKSLEQVLDRYRKEETAQDERVNQRILDDLPKQDSPFRKRTEG